MFLPEHERKEAIGIVESVDISSVKDKMEANPLYSILSFFADSEPLTEEGKNHHSNRHLGIENHWRKTISQYYDTFDPTKTYDAIHAQTLDKLTDEETKIVTQMIFFDDNVVSKKLSSDDITDILHK